MNSPAYIELLMLTLGAAVSDLSDTATLTTGSASVAASAHFQILNPNGSNRNVLLPALVSTTRIRSRGLWYMIRNSGSANNLVVKNSTGVTTYATLAPGDWIWMVSSGSTPSWYVAAGSTTPTSLTLTGAISAASATLTGALAAASATLTGALSAAAATFSGRVTTTDGVSSGDARVVGGNVHTKTSATTVANTTTETTIGSHSLAANMIKAGTQVRVRGSLRVTGVNATPTIVLKLKLGGTTFLTSASLSVIGNDVAVFDAVITGRAAPGASAEVVAEATMTATQSGTPATSAQVAAPANYATNGALIVSATVQWSAAHASNSLTCDSFSVDVIG